MYAKGQGVPRDYKQAVYGGLGEQAPDLREPVRDHFEVQADVEVC
jgi:hypothetical protein